MIQNINVTLLLCFRRKSFARIRILNLRYAFSFEFPLPDGSRRPLPNLNTTEILFNSCLVYSCIVNALVV